jgi:excisionase family DNA binding protein
MLAFPSMKGKQSDSSMFLSVDEAARLVGLSHWTLRSWLQKGLLTRYKSVSRTLVNRAELLELLKPKKSSHENSQLGRDNRISVAPISKNKKLQQP